MKNAAFWRVVICLVTPTAFFIGQGGNSSRATAETNCVSNLPGSLSVKCVSFLGHLYAVAEIDLRSQRIVFTTSDNEEKKTYPQVFSDLSREGIRPLLLTNAGIYGLDNRPLGLLVSPKGKLQEANTTADAGGNFSWNSAVFQVSDDDVASIVPVTDWHGSRHIVAATQSGPQIAIAGKINQSLPVQSKWSYLRTAIGVAQKNPKRVYLVVSREPVTLYDLATFMVSTLHCSDALHLDGDLSALYLPSTPQKFLFSDPGQRIVTALSVIDK